MHDWRNHNHEVIFCSKFTWKLAPSAATNSNNCVHFDKSTKIVTLIDFHLIHFWMRQIRPSNLPASHRQHPHLGSAQSPKKLSKIHYWLLVDKMMRKLWLWALWSCALILWPCDLLRKLVAFMWIVIQFKKAPVVEYGVSCIVLKWTSRDTDVWDKMKSWDS